MGLRGEPMESAEVSGSGILGDRSHVLVDADADRVIDPIVWQYNWGKTEALPRMLELGAVYVPGPGGPVKITATGGSPVSSNESDATRTLSEMLGRRLKIVPSPEVMADKARRGRAVHVLTTASLARLQEAYPEGDFAVQRFRPNVLVTPSSGLTGFVEDGWLGRGLSLGRDVRLKVDRLNKRCSFTTLQQPGLPEDRGILETVASQNRNVLGVLCSVELSGAIRVGDPVCVI
jgi:uncharacterized protein YcbX